jgi:hypothetical protein
LVQGALAQQDQPGQSCVCGAAAVSGRHYWLPCWRCLDTSSNSYMAPPGVG